MESSIKPGIALFTRVCHKDDDINPIPRLETQQQIIVRATLKQMHRVWFALYMSSYWSYWPTCQSISRDNLIEEIIHLPSASIRCAWPAPLIIVSDRQSLTRELGDKRTACHGHGGW